MPALYPAIDILGGKAVRLEQGDFGRGKAYDADPLDAARRWVEQGATWLHVVDLDGAREGRPVNRGQLERIAAEAGVSVQYGGGLRSGEAVGEAIAAGASRVVVGTVAFTQPEVLDDMIDRVGDRVRIAVDVRDGVVATSGWLSTTLISAPDAVEMLKTRGAGGFVYTSVDRDGTMRGPDVETVVPVCHAARPAPVVYSGGIGSVEDLRALAALPLEGVIVGKALYEGRFTVAEALEVL
ncbi:MAG: 1-(5-phosphoribosyl)-5-[(5-phosphoribosylamino)methylideneamino]imidazole-4-carboxamide isomerase [Solirubrobacterales bacterium]